MHDEQMLDFSNGLELLDGIELDVVPQLGVAILTLRSFRMYPERPPSELHHLEPIGMTLDGLRSLQAELTGLIRHMESLGIPGIGRLPKGSAH